ncbi:MAG: MFS transporter [Ktedonobacterales bacterium]|nr:MFS transporter [Ktedonobacterales bacterium]
MATPHTIPGTTNTAAAKQGGATAAPPNGGWILFATILGSSMAFIDSTVVNVALPVLQRDLHATTADVLWVVEGYALFLAALILVGGALGDRFGRKRIYATGIVIFAVASAICGIAQSPGQLIVARAVQGIGGALLTPGSLAIISATFPAKERGRAIGTWSGFTTVTSALGPVVGGFLIQFSWRWIFFINLPLAALALAVLFIHVPETKDEGETGPLDIRGALLATVGLGALVFGLIQAGSAGFGHAGVILPLVVGVAALAGFLFLEQHERNPMMPLKLFSSRMFSATNLLTFFLYGALGGALYFLPFKLQQLHGYTALQSGISLLPFTIIMFGLSRWAGGLVAQYGARLPLVIGPTLAGIGFLLYARTGTDGNYWTQYFPAVLVLALGMTITVSPLTTSVMNAVSQDRAGIASGVNNAVARTASLVAVAVFGIIVAQIFISTVTGNLTGLHLDPATQHAMLAQRDKLLGAQVPANVAATTHHAIAQALDNAFVMSFRVAMLVGAALAFGSALIAYFFIDGDLLPKRGEIAAKPTGPSRALAGKARRIPSRN